MPYEVLDKELQVLEAIGEFRDPVSGELYAYDHKANLWYEGEVIPDDKVSPLIKDALDDEDEGNQIYAHLKDRLAKVGDTEEARLNLARRIGVPIEDYHDRDEDEILAVLKVLSSPLVSAIKEYEALHEARPRILEYNVGLREGVDERVTGMANAEPSEPEEGKEAADVPTRDVGVNDSTEIRRVNESSVDVVEESASNSKKSSKK